MTVISRQEEMMNEMVANQGKLNVDVWDGMGAAMADAWDAGPTQALVRGAKSFFDTSEEISAEEANQLYGLQGTEAEFKPDEKITVNAAREKAASFHDIQMNNIIKETVNQDSPIIGNVTQFAASMAVSMVDPTMIAANVAGGAVIGAGVKAMTNSTRMFNGIAKASPAIAKSLLSAYADDAARSLATVVAREGLENFASSLIEETVIQGGLTLGDERYGRKYTWQDSFQNIVAGTLMGTVLGSVGPFIGKEGRKAIADRYLYDWGDDAAEFVNANTIIASLEASSGHQKGRLEMDMMNREKFSNRPWYNVQEATFSPSNTSTPKRIWLALDENGNAHTSSFRGNGAVFTGSQVHAMNSGVKVVEVHTDKLKLANQDTFVQNGASTKLGQTVGHALVNDFVNQVSPDKLTKALAILSDANASLDIPTKRMSELKVELARMMEGKNLDQMTDLMHDLKSRTESGFDMHATIENTLDKEGFNGYVFQGKDFDGKPAYQGVYVSQKYSDRIRRQATHDVPQPSAGDKVKWQFEAEQMFRKHKDWVKAEAKSLREVQDIKESMGLPKETPVEEVAAKVKQNHVQEALASTKERVNALARAKDSVAAEIESLKAQGKEIDPELEKSVRIMEAIQNGTDPAKLVEADHQMWDNYASCILGLATSVAKEA